MRIVSEAEATARLRIMLPTTMPTPSTALRPQAVWEDTHVVEPPATTTPFAQVAASPASPSTLPSQLAAMTTATMVIPLPPSVRPGSGLLTTTLPPDQAAQANAAKIGDAFRDTIEEIFGVDFDTVDPAELGLAPRVAAGSGASAREPLGGFEGTYGGGYDSLAEYDAAGYDSSADYDLAGYDSSADVGHLAHDLAAQSFPPIPSAPWSGAVGDPAPTVTFPRPVPAAMFGGAYGVPTQQAPFPMAPGRLAPFGQPAETADTARHALALRYLGGIFHDSSGESSFLDPEELDQGWIPSAFGAAPPDAPTERIARIPSAESELGMGMGMGMGSGASGAHVAPPRPRPQPVADPSASAAPSASSATSSAASTASAAGSGLGSAAAQPSASSGSATSGVSGTGVTSTAADPYPADPYPSNPYAANPANATSAASTPSTAGSTPRSGTRSAHATKSARSASAGRSDRAKGRRKQAAAREPAAARERSGGGRGRALTIAGLCVAAFALLYGVALLLSGNVVGGAIPKGTVIAGIPIGGLSPDAARAKLESALGPASLKPVELMVGQTPTSIDPAKSGLSFDVDATLAEAESQRTNPFTIIPALFGVHHDLAPVTDTDTGALTGALASIAASYDTPLVEGKITFTDGQPVVTVPRQGRGFDVPTAVAAISSGYLQVSGPIALPVSSLDPLATPYALQNALEQLARPAVSAPITLVTGGVTTVLTPTQIGDALTIGPNADGTMVPTVNGDLLRADLNPAALALEQSGSNAAFTVVSGQPQLIPERDGVGFAPQALSSAVSGVLAAASPRSVTLQTGPLPPAFTTADAQALGVTAVLGTTTLAVPDAADRVADTQRATGLVMGSVVAPGAVWSFDKTVGAPTSANGFAEPDASTAKNEGVDLSGGDDLVATAVFDAAFRAGMGDTVHHPNAAYDSRYPVGLDAAVVWPGTDLQWTDTGAHPVYLYADYADGQLTVAVLGQPVYDQVSVTVSDRSEVVPASSDPHSGCPAQSASDGFQVDVTRVLLRGGAQVGTEQFHVGYVPFAGTVCGSGSGTGSSSGTPSGSSEPGSGSTGGGSPSNGANNGSGGSGGSGANPTPPASPNPAPTNTGVLGGLLH
jgi:vancomycin resistance protein YoaR